MSFESLLSLVFPCLLLLCVGGLYWLSRRRSGWRVRDWKMAGTLAMVVMVIYGLFAWERLAQPSPQFHFVDLAHSLMSGRLDTDTPRQHRGMSRPADPAGYRLAIERTLESGGWNDWSAIRTLKLKGNEVVHGRFPYPSASAGDERRHIFYTHDGRQMKIDVSKDLERTCGESGRSRCDETKYYVSFPPMPGVVMLPLVAVIGYEVNDVTMTIGFAGLNVALLFLLLQLLVARGHSTRSRRDNISLALLFAFGSVAFFSSIRGEVWFTALVMGVTFNLLYMICALDLRHPILAGLMLAFGLATRTPIAFCVVFFAWQLFFPGSRWTSGRWKEIVTKGALFSVPIVVCGVALMAYNDARFHSYFEFGHSYLSGGAGDRIRDHGLFNFWYLNKNLHHALIELPRFNFDGTGPIIQISKHGLGLLVTMPVLFLLFRPGRKTGLMTALWLTVAAAALPGLLYQNTGWSQFSYRFALDYLPYLLVLLALGSRPFTWRVKFVCALCVLFNTFGAVTFERFTGLYF